MSEVGVSEEGVYVRSSSCDSFYWLAELNFGQEPVFLSVLILSFSQRSCFLTTKLP